MAERPQGFARRMMAQRLMSDARDDPFSDSRFFSGRIRPSMQDMAEPTRFSDMAMPAYATGATASLFAPGAGVTDIMGFAPDPAQPGEFLPSFGQNITQGNYLDAGLQALGGAGDVMMAGGTIIPPLVGVGAALKAPRAARVAGQAVDAAKNVDEARAALEASPNDPVLKQQYLDLRRQRDVQLSQMSASEQLELDVSYRMDHQPRGPQDGGGRLDDITSGGELFPDDVYSADGLRLYGNPNNAFDRQSYAAIMAARGNPDAEITIYRAVPQDVDQINPGDWVTLSPEYASVHAASGYGPDGQQAGKVISQRVRVKDVYSDGNDLNEFGFFPSELADAGVKKIVPPTETEPGIIAFHGSGADFDEFRLEMIGTGEGAQAYGYGLYFTDSEDIAKFYRNTVSTGTARIPYGGAEDAAQAVPDNVPFVDVDGYRSYSIEDAEKVLESVLTKQYGGEPPEPSIVDFNLEILKRSGVLNAEMPDGTKASLLMNQAGDQFTLTPVKERTGKMYKVALSPKPDELLDYDLPLSQQPEMLKLIDDAHGDSEIILKQAGLDPATATGGQLVNALGGIAQTIEQQKAGADFLLKAGIPGIKYRASGSRGAGVTDEAAERNYVIFDDSAIKILEKYGIVGPVLVTGGAVAATQRGGDEEGSIFPDA